MLNFESNVLQLMRFVCVILFVLCSQPAAAGRIRKAYDALAIYNYFEAKRLFEKCQSKQPVESCYGMSIIYQRKDNPFSNADSAYNLICRAVLVWPQMDEKTRVKCAAFGIDSAALITQRALVSADLFQTAVAENLIASFQQFIDKNPWSEWVDNAVFMRDSLAFEQAILSGKAKGYEIFLATYPNSVFVRAAKSSFDRLLYVENTVNDNFVDYLTFLQKFPESPYRPDAEDRIYEISTRLGTAESYAQFIRDFPQNHNVNNAWRRLFNAHLQDEYSIESLEDFRITFPDYPFLNELKRQIEAVNVELLPAMSNGIWQFMSTDGSVQIDREFEEVDRFSEGLAVVRTESKYGYMNNLGEIVIQELYDDALQFREGHAVVQIGDNWGMINRSGEFVIQPVYENLGSLSNGLIYFEKDGLYGYFDKNGSIRIPPTFTDANDFANGRAIVATEEGFGLIDKFGTFILPATYEDMEFYTEGKLKAKIRSNWGIINESGDSLVSFMFDYIAIPKDGLTLVDRGGEFNYLKNSEQLLLSNWLESYPESRQLSEFQSGFARIRTEKGMNLIDTSGQKIFLRDQQKIGRFGNPIAVQKGKHWGYLSKTGATVIPNSFTMAESFSGDFATAGSEPLWGLINKKGKYVIEPYFEELIELNDSLWIAKSRGNYGVLSISGDTLLAFSYLSIDEERPGLLRLGQNGFLGYYNLQTAQYIRREE